MCGEQSTLAPTSSTITGWVGPLEVGKRPASAGRFTPGTTPCMIFAVAITAPVLPADTNPAARPSRTSRDATFTELSRLVRTALVGSSMVTFSLACTTSIGRSSQSSYVENSCRTRSSWPTRMTFTPNCRAARTAPSTSAFGAWSPPIASNATVSIWEPELLLCDFDYFAALVLPAVRAHAVRQFGLVAVGTFRKARRLSAHHARAASRSAFGSVYVLD